MSTVQNTAAPRGADAPGQPDPQLDPSAIELSRQLRRRLGLGLALSMTSTAALATVVTACLTHSPAWLATAALLGATAGWRYGDGARWLAGLDSRTLGAHLDRRIPGLEESAALLLEPPARPTALERLQQERVAGRWTAALSDRNRWLPVLRWRGPALMAALCLLLIPLATSEPFLTRPGSLTSPAPLNERASGPLPVRLRRLDIEPPAYTGLPVRSQQDYELNVPEGSRLRWELILDKDTAPGLTPSIVINDGEVTRLTATAADDGSFRFEHIAARTGLYRITDGTDAGRSTDIHTLAVQRDRVPVLTVIEPAENRLEIALEGPAVFRSQILVRDDFGVGPVEIRASVASGAGEGVKFRDESFPLENGEASDEGVLYTRDWSLEALAMEPGDELYFFAVAQDSRTPEPNEGRSDTRVVRWQDETVAPVQAAGIAIDVLPEYFKSQRQIIIETEALIADREELGEPRFETLSRSLAQAQADLKERYGQYLGDEYEDGDAAAFAPDDASDPANAAEAADPAAHEHGDHDHAGHDHGDAPSVDTSGDAQALISRFMHDHGAADIGRITRRNPVGLMKRSLSNMWQAELHLHLAEPEKALPYELEALKYLNLARQADRIYTQRLGFEPPPVTEDRRLTGKLDDVESRRRQQSGSDTVDEEQLARGLYAALGSLMPGEPLPGDVRDLLRRAAEHFTALSQDRPALIRHVATMERMMLADRIDPPACEDCRASLADAAWSLAGPLLAGPTRRPFDAGAHAGPAASERELENQTEQSANRRYQEALRALAGPASDAQPDAQPDAQADTVEGAGR